MLRKTNCFFEKSLIFLKNNSGVEFNAIDLYGNPPLYYAIHKNRIPLIKMLLSKPEVKLNSKFKSGSTLLHSAVEKGEVNVLKILLDNGSNINEQGTF